MTKRIRDAQEIHPLRLVAKWKLLNEMNPRSLLLTLILLNAPTARAQKPINPVV
jgi:hypothetical protein